MLSAYRNMDSYPFQRNQMPFPYYHHHHPGIEPISPQMTMDPSKSHFPYEQPWPYANTYGHNHPMPTHFCCGHNNFPGYYGYRPYYHPHASAPLPMYPSYGEPFFSPYSPQSHYTMELPRYEYDKYMPRERDHHCCGCPNHSCNQKEGKSVRIEEQEADVGKKEKDDVVPVQLRNYPHPLVWIPSEYYGNKQLRNPSTNEVGEQGKMVHDKKPHGAENFKVDEKLAQEEPRVHWNGWFPFDIKSAPNMVQDGDGIRNQKRESDKNVMVSEGGRMDHKQQSEHKRPEFQFPIIWLPNYNNQEEGGRVDNDKRNSTPESIEEVPHSFKSVPVKSDTNKTRSNEVESRDSASDVAKKASNQRSIPVKQVESHQEKNNFEGSEKREVDASLKKKEENVTKEDSHSSTKRGSNSPRSASKLPPVCLRVDPLPRKKNGNGSSRSPSPPASKKHSQETAGETNKTPSSGMNDKVKPDSNSSLKNSPNASEEVTPKVRTIQVSESKVSENKDGECRDESQNQINRPSGVSNTDGGIYKAEDKKEDKKLEILKGEAIEDSVKDSSTSTDKGGKKDGRVLLDGDAAVLIQAAYRGYQVRKWELLKKLKQIGEVSKEVDTVKGSVQAFEGSPDLQKDEKQQIAIGETIMRLLLKLDTLQGLHPSLRETRKSLARELVTLQERLDSMMANRPQQQMQQLNVQEPVEVSPLNMENKEYHQDSQEEKLDAAREDSSKGISGSSDDTLEKHQDQLYMKDGDSNFPINDGERGSQSSVDLPSNDREEPNELPSGLVEEQISPMVSVDAMDSTKAAECEAKSELNDILPIEIDEPDVSALKELPVGVIDVDITSADSDNKKKNGLNSDINAMMELQVGLLDEDAATSEFGKDDETNIPKGEAQAESEEFIEELPVGLLDEEIEKSEVVQGEGEECNSNGRAGSSIDDSAKETQQEQSLMEEHVDVQSSGDSDGWVKLEFQKEDELKGDAPQDGNVNKLPCLAEQVNDPYQGNEEVCLEANDVADILQEPTEVMSIDSLQKENQVEENVAQKETKVDRQEDKDAGETLAKEDIELSNGLTVAKHDEGNGDMKLLEENEKLRKLMKELLNAGNEQLFVISNLTGRVKDLEKKLAKSKRSKKVKTKKHRVATSKISHWDCNSSE